MTQENLDMTLVLLAWHNTPTDRGHYSPVQKLQSQTHTQLPTASKLLKPEILKGIENKIQWRRQKAKQQYDKTAKELPALAVTQVVQIQPVKHHE